MEMLKIENLTKYYGRTLGVKNLSLTVGEGEIFGFIGPNGAGKSTTIRCVMNLLNKTSGSVYILGELFDKGNIALKREIGYLPGEIYLYDDMTVSGMLAYSKSFYGGVDESRLSSLVSKLKLDTDKKVEDLSLGNLKKLGIILALMHKPKLIIMDEATNGLDPLMQEAFYEILREERDSGATIFFSSHNLSEVRRLCDRVAIISGGELKKVDTIDNLTGGNVHIVTLGCDDDEVAARLGGKVIETDSGNVKFIYDGEPVKLISELSGKSVSTLLIEEPSLEEVFMHYYK